MIAPTLMVASATRDYHLFPSVRSSARRATFVALIACSWLPSIAHATCLVEAVSGKVEVRAPSASTYKSVSKGDNVPHGARLRTLEGASAKLRFTDGTLLGIEEATEIIVRAPSQDGPKRTSIILFIGRVWAKVVKLLGGSDRFEVRSANAVAGVRGTELAVGVALDGSTRVIVSEGEVAVEGDKGARTLIEGRMVEASSSGVVGAIEKAPKNPDWEGWFSKKAKQMRARGLAVAKDLDGRLNRRAAKLRRLLAQQKNLQKRIARMERKNADPAKIQAALDEMTRLGERIESMRGRLLGAFGLFDRWRRVAAAEDFQDARAIGRIADNVDAIAKDFADMIEEGTDQSVEGMEEMMDDMRKGKTGRPKDDARDELFR